MRMLIGFLLLASCGNHGASTSDATQGVDDVMLDVIETSDASVCEESMASGTHKLFLAFEGLTLTPGRADATLNRAEFLEAPATIPAMYAGDQDRIAKLRAIACGIGAWLYPFDIEVVTSRPASGDYEMIVFGGDAGQLGLQDGIRAAAGTDCTSSNHRDVGWVAENASGALAPPEVAVNLAASVFGVGNGLDPSGDATNCMCYMGTAQGCDFAAQCSFSASSGIRTDYRICSTTQTVEDQVARLIARYGARP